MVIPTCTQPHTRTYAKAVLTAHISPFSSSFPHSFHVNGDALMVAVTGKALDPQVFLKYLTKKYSDIYRL